MTCSFAAHEELEAEFNGRFDYMSEAYGATARDCNAMAAEDEALELQMYRDEMEPEYGPYAEPPRRRAPGFGYHIEIVTMSAEDRHFGPFVHSPRNVGFDDLPW